MVLLSRLGFMLKAIVTRVWEGFQKDLLVISPL